MSGLLAAAEQLDGGGVAGLAGAAGKGGLDESVDGLLVVEAGDEDEGIEPGSTAGDGGALRDGLEVGEGEEGAGGEGNGREGG
jgi:hypothetical protein